MKRKILILLPLFLLTVVFPMVVNAADWVETFDTDIIGSGDWVVYDFGI